MNIGEKRRLGRGLGAILGDVEVVVAPGEVTRLPVEHIQPNPFQPRRDFDAEEIAALAQSLQSHGLLQPILVRRIETGYQLIAGERRLRAARQAGWLDIPARIVDFDDQQVFEATMIENLHRTDLNPIEKARSFRDYLQRFGVTQEELARRLGLDRSTVTNFIRLLDLPEEVQDAVRRGQISAGHARCLLTLDDPGRQTALCRDIVARGLSVRTVEALVRQERPSKESQPPTVPRREKTAHVQSLEDELKRLLALRVEIRVYEGDRGQLVVWFENTDDFERLFGIVRRGALAPA